MPRTCQQYSQQLLLSTRVNFTSSNIMNIIIILINTRLSDQITCERRMDIVMMSW